MCDKVLYITRKDDKLKSFWLVRHRDDMEEKASAFSSAELKKICDNPDSADFPVIYEKEDCTALFYKGFQQTMHKTSRNIVAGNIRNLVDALDAGIPAKNVGITYIDEDLRHRVFLCKKALSQDLSDKLGYYIDGNTLIAKDGTEIIKIKDSHCSPVQVLSKINTLTTLDKLPEDAIPLVVDYNLDEHTPRVKHMLCYITLPDMRIEEVGPLFDGHTMSEYRDYIKVCLSGNVGIDAADTRVAILPVIDDVQRNEIQVTTVCKDMNEVKKFVLGNLFDPTVDLLGIGKKVFRGKEETEDIAKLKKYGVINADMEKLEVLDGAR